MPPIEVSIVIEGYNESLEIGCIDETIEALRAQLHPLDRVELLLVGSQQQAAAWRSLEAHPLPFHSVRVIPTDGDHYYALKNRGASIASGEVLAFLDSDVMPTPHWLGSIVDAFRAGAMATCGPSLFRQGPLASALGLPLLAAASVSWGFILGRDGKASGFLSHNLAIRKSLFDQVPYRTDLGRTCAGSFLMDTLRSLNISPTFQPQQRVAHAFTWLWWTTRLHVRFGHEVYLLHRLGSGTVSRSARWLGPLDAIVTPAWHFLLDFDRWWRYSKALALPIHSRLAGLLVTPAVSAAARLAESAGMFATIASPKSMAAFAARN